MRRLCIFNCFVKDTKRVDIAIVYSLSNHLIKQLFSVDPIENEGFYALMLLLRKTQGSRDKSRSLSSFAARLAADLLSWEGSTMSALRHNVSMATPGSSAWSAAKWAPPTMILSRIRFLNLSYFCHSRLLWLDISFGNDASGFVGHQKFGRPQGTWVPH